MRYGVKAFLTIIQLILIITTITATYLTFQPNEICVYIGSPSSYMYEQLSKGGAYQFEIGIDKLGKRLSNAKKLIDPIYNEGGPSHRELIVGSNIIAIFIAIILLIIFKGSTLPTILEFVFLLLTIFHTSLYFKNIFPPTLKYNQVQIAHANPDGFISNLLDGPEKKIYELDRNKMIEFKIEISQDNRMIIFEDQHPIEAEPIKNQNQVELNPAPQIIYVPQTQFVIVTPVPPKIYEQFVYVPPTPTSAGIYEIFDPNDGKKIYTNHLSESDFPTPIPDFELYMDYEYKDFY